MKKNHITGIILAGGKSTRMGEEKGLAKYKNQPFIAHIINQLKPLVDTILIVSNNNAYLKFGYEVITDKVKEKGPLAGLYTGLSHSTTVQNLILSCDVPLIKKEVLELLIENDTPETDALICESKGRIMPLIALYKKKCTSNCKQLLDKDKLKMMGLLHQLNVKKIVLPHDLELCTNNVNTKKELNEIVRTV